MKTVFNSSTPTCKVMTLLFLTVFIFFNCLKNDKNQVKPSLISQTVTDIDGNTYKTVKIGNQWWMAENLKVTHFRNGELIPILTDSIEWANLTSGVYCNYDNDANNVATYGRLYNWYAVNDNRNLAPAGWHMPSDAEWQQLEICLGMNQSEANQEGYRGTDIGGKLKEAGTSHWNKPNKGASNASGFFALASGICTNLGYKCGLMNSTFFWTSTKLSIWFLKKRNSGRAWGRYLSSDESGVYRKSYDMRFGFSVRCIKDRD
jgi:uncharacterized protein (TIGR02145 family)